MSCSTARVTLANVLKTIWDSHTKVIACNLMPNMLTFKSLRTCDKFICIAKTRVPIIKN